MYLKCNRRKKDGKEHRYWSIVESHRVSGGKTIKKEVLYLGEINSTQREAWRRTIKVLGQGKKKKAVQLSLFPNDRGVPVDDDTVVQVKLNELELKRPRQFGACWLADRLWHQLHLEQFWGNRLPRSRKGTNWVNVLKTSTAYHLISGGSEWQLHRQWYTNSAMSDLLGEDGVIQKDKLYRCLDKLVEHKTELFQHLRKRWERMFDAHYDVLLYELTSTYFECDPPEEGKRKYGYSRDHRGDCVQVVIALVITPEGFPLAYEVMPGNTRDSATLRKFLDRIERDHGKVNRTWIMDRGIPTEEVLAEMREAGTNYLVGTPKGKLTSLEKSFQEKPWQKVRDSVSVKLHKAEDEFYVLVESEKRVCKEQSMRRRRLKKFWKRLVAIREMKRINRDQLLMKVGAAKKDAGRTAGLIKLDLPKIGEPINEKTFRFEINKRKMKAWRRKEGRYLLRSNMVNDDPALLWSYYLRLTEVEQAFKELKSDLAVRPIYHSTEKRIEAHIFMAFMAYCLMVTLKNLLRRKASGLTPRAVLEKMAEIQMVDVHLPTEERQVIVLPRYTSPGKDHKLILQLLDLNLPKQPTPYLKPLEERPGEKESVAKLMHQIGYGLTSKSESKPTSVEPVPHKRTKRTRRSHVRKCGGDFYRRPQGLARVRVSRPP